MEQVMKTVTTKEFKKLSATTVKVFASTLNSKGKTRISIVRGENATNYKEGDLLWQKEFSSWNRIHESALNQAKETI